MFIEAQDLYKSFGELPVLRGVSLEIRKGEVLTITGKSGAGKSTLLHIMGLLDKPDRGRVLFEGTDVFGLSAGEQADFRNLRIGFVFQFHHLLPEFTALENVLIPTWIRGDAAAFRKKALDLLAYLGLQDRVEHKPGQLSGGEQQRVAVARALINGPAVVFADEPTGNLDSASSADMHRLFLQMRSDFQQTFVIVTHNQELASLSDRNLHLTDGKFDPPAHD